jgi:hypothetical protein
MQELILFDLSAVGLLGGKLHYSCCVSPAAAFMLWVCLAASCITAVRLLVLLLLWCCGFAWLQAALQLLTAVTSVL